jgi:hypothetical protein
MYTQDQLAQKCAIEETLIQRIQQLEAELAARDADLFLQSSRSDLAKSSPGPPARFPLFPISSIPQEESLKSKNDVSAFSAISAARFGPYRASDESEMDGYEELAKAMGIGKACELVPIPAFVTAANQDRPWVRKNLARDSFEGNGRGNGGVNVHIEGKSQGISGDKREEKGEAKSEEKSGRRWELMAEVEEQVIV